MVIGKLGNEWNIVQPLFIFSIDDGVVKGGNQRKGGREAVEEGGARRRGEERGEGERR